MQQGDSGRAYILVDPEGERTILVAPNTNDQLEEKDLPREALQEARFLHLTSFVGDAPLKLQRPMAVSLPDGPASPWTRANFTPAGAGPPWRSCWIGWRPCW